MNWDDLSMKEKHQNYVEIRKQHPYASYWEIKDLWNEEVAPPNPYRDLKAPIDPQKATPLDQTTTMDYLWKVENPQGVGLKDGTVEAFVDAAGRWTIGPGLDVKSTKGVEVGKKYPKAYIDSLGFYQKAVPMDAKTMRGVGKYTNRLDTISTDVRLHALNKSWQYNDLYKQDPKINPNYKQLTEDAYKAIATDDIDGILKISESQRKNYSNRFLSDPYNYKEKLKAPVDAYQDGVKKEENAAEFSLPEVEIYPQNRFGDIARSQGLDTARNWNKVRTGVTTGINDFANDPRTGFVEFLLPIPQGIEGVKNLFRAAKAAKSLKSKRVKPDYDFEFSEYLRRDKVANKYEDEISNVYKDLSNEDAVKLAKDVDNTYGTNYVGAYEKMVKDPVNFDWKPLNNAYGRTNMKNVSGNTPSKDVKDYSIDIDLDQYVAGTANHELGHVADAVNGTIYKDFESGRDYLTNPYLRYLADSGDAYSANELRGMGEGSAAGMRDYLLNPTEAKSHMLTLKRALKQAGIIDNWNSKITDSALEKYSKLPDTNKAVLNQIKLYKNRKKYLRKLNELPPAVAATMFYRRKEKNTNKSN